MGTHVAPYCKSIHGKTGKNPKRKMFNKPKTFMVLKYTMSDSLTMVLGSQKDQERMSNIGLQNLTNWLNLLSLVSTLMEHKWHLWT